MLLSRHHNMQPNTLTRREYKVKCMLRILEKIQVGFDQYPEPDTDPKPTEK
jgi:hypothetical protein